MAEIETRPETAHPLILAFLCDWCSYEGADAAGRARIGVCENLRIVRLPCTGRIEPRFVLEAFSSGAGGVLILGCRPGECHFREGNFNALRLSIFLKPLLSQLGVAPQRFRIDWVSAKDGQRFAQIVDDMAAILRRLKQVPAW